jgi:hypothetical protein
MTYCENSPSSVFLQILIDRCAHGENEALLVRYEQPFTVSRFCDPPKIARRMFTPPNFDAPAPNSYFGDYSDRYLGSSLTSAVSARFRCHLGTLRSRSARNSVSSAAARRVTGSRRSNAAARSRGRTASSCPTGSTRNCCLEKGIVEPSARQTAGVDRVGAAPRGVRGDAAYCAVAASSLVSSAFSAIGISRFASSSAQSPAALRSSVRVV